MFRRTDTNRQPEKKKPRRGRLGFTSYMLYEEPSPARQFISAWSEKQDLAKIHAVPAGRGGVMLTLGRLLLDTSGSGLGFHDQDPAKAERVAFSSGDGSLDTGVILVRSRALRIFTLAGISGTASSIQREGLSTGNGHGDTSSSSWGTGSLQVGIGLDLIIPLWRLKLLLGVRTGYRYALLSAQAGEGPQIDLPTGPFFRVVSGLHFGR